MRCAQITIAILAFTGVSSIQSCFSQVSVLVNRHRAGIALISPTHLYILFKSMLATYSIKLSVKRISPSKMESTSIYAHLTANISWCDQLTANCRKTEGFSKTFVFCYWTHLYLGRRPTWYRWCGLATRPQASRPQPITVKMDAFCMGIIWWPQAIHLAQHKKAGPFEAK